MKKFKVSLIAILSALSLNAHANSGTLTISGTAGDSTCVVAPEQMTRTIDITGVTPATLNAAAPGESVFAQDIEFDATSCPSTTTGVGLRVDFAPHATSNEYLINSGTATGVAVGITDSSDVLQTSGSIILADDLDATAGTATVKTKIQAYRVGGETVAGGTIASAANITLINY